MVKQFITAYFKKEVVNTRFINISLGANLLRNGKN